MIQATARSNPVKPDQTESLIAGLSLRLLTSAATRKGAWSNTGLPVAKEGGEKQAGQAQSNPDFKPAGVAVIVWLPTGSLRYKNRDAPALTVFGSMGLKIERRCAILRQCV